MVIRRAYTTSGLTDPPSHGKFLERANPLQLVNPALEKGSSQGGLTLAGYWTRVSA